LSMQKYCKLFVVCSYCGAAEGSDDPLAPRFLNQNGRGQPDAPITP
jgi:translation initiation factor 2 beta subunit (eIF-2beta)/eIF-5